ncbi:unnamed protein product, partial [Mesorhabditis spiculigera]
MDDRMEGGSSSIKEPEAYAEGRVGIKRKPELKDTSIKPIKQDNPGILMTVIKRFKGMAIDGTRQPLTDITETTSAETLAATGSDEPPSGTEGAGVASDNKTTVSTSEIITGLMMPAERGFDGQRSTLGAVLVHETTPWLFPRHQTEYKIDGAAIEASLLTMDQTVPRAFYDSLLLINAKNWSEGRPLAFTAPIGDNTTATSPVPTEHSLEDAEVHDENEPIVDGLSMSTLSISDVPDGLPDPALIGDLAQLDDMGRDGWWSTMLVNNFAFAHPATNALARTKFGMVDPDVQGFLMLDCQIKEFLGPFERRLYGTLVLWLVERILKHDIGEKQGAKLAVVCDSQDLLLEAGDICELLGVPYHQYGTSPKEFFPAMILLTPAQFVDGFLETTKPYDLLQVLFVAPEPLNEEKRGLLIKSFQTLVAFHSTSSAKEPTMYEKRPYTKWAQFILMCEKEEARLSKIFEIKNTSKHTFDVVKNEGQIKNGFKGTPQGKPRNCR